MKLKIARGRTMCQNCQNGEQERIDGTADGTRAGRYFQEDVKRPSSNAASSACLLVLTDKHKTKQQVIPLSSHSPLLAALPADPPDFSVPSRLPQHPRSTRDTTCQLFRAPHNGNSISVDGFFLPVFCNCFH